MKTTSIQIFYIPVEHLFNMQEMRDMLANLKGVIKVTPGKPTGVLSSVVDIIITSTTTKGLESVIRKIVLRMKSYKGVKIAGKSYSLTDLYGS